MCQLPCVDSARRTSQGLRRGTARDYISCSSARRRKIFSPEQLSATSSRPNSGTGREFFHFGSSWCVPTRRIRIGTKFPQSFFVVFRTGMPVVLEWLACDQVHTPKHSCELGRISSAFFWSPFQRRGDFGVFFTLDWDVPTRPFGIEMTWLQQLRRNRRVWSS